MSVPSVERAPRHVEALLQSLGADRDFADDVLGDLTEEYLLRVQWDGALSARRWYYAQALRTAPYLLRDWRRRLGPRDVSSVAVAMLSAVLAAFAADAAIVALLPRLTFFATGIPLGAYINHWRSTGDMMPWAFVALASRQILPAMTAGCVAGLVGKRAPLVHGLILSATIFVAVSSIAVGRFMTFSLSATHVLVTAASLAVSCLAGGVLAALWVRRRASRELAERLRSASA
jgi:hypothetical protein